MERYANNPVETDHGRLKARLRPMRGSWPPRTTQMRTKRRVVSQSAQLTLREANHLRSRECPAYPIGSWARRTA